MARSSRSSSRTSTNTRTNASAAQVPNRAASTMSAPASTPQTVYAAPQQQGVLSQIATTAAGVALGHTVGRAITGMFGGGGSAAEQQPVAQPIQAFSSSGNAVSPQCQEYSRMFLQCMSQNNNEVPMCQDYMEMIKSCQQQFA